MFFDARDLPKVSGNDSKWIWKTLNIYHFFQNFDVILRRGDYHILACPGLSCPCPVLFWVSFTCLKLSWLDSSLSCPVLSMFMTVFTKGQVLSTWRVCLKLKIPYHLKMSGKIPYHLKMSGNLFRLVIFRSFLYVILMRIPYQNTQKYEL